jgi:outer membrane protein OmpA-like peptidoglycan-associated protein
MPEARPGAPLCALGLLAILAGDAQAQERWILTAEAPAAMAVSDPQSDWFAGGVMPSATVYRSLAPWLLVGGRLRAGFLAAGSSPGEPLMDKGAGGLGSTTLAVRVRPLGGRESSRRGTGLWLEAAGGGALTGRDLRPTAELGLGFGFAAGPVAIGPALRYVHLVQPDDHLSPADARLALLGVELTFLDRERVSARLPVVAAVRRPAPRPAPAAPPAEPAIEPPSDRDGDGIPDDQDACPDEPETVNGVDDHDGCPDEGLFVVVEDRITLDERVLFDTDRARVKRGGRRVLGAIASYLAAHPEFARVEIHGHADARGAEDYNLRLSQIRGQRVQQVLRQFGVA